MPEYKSLTDLGINPFPFDVLKPDHNLVKIMALQCSGTIDTAGHVINAEVEKSAAKHRKFLSLALEREASLVITPEYSCPWTVIDSIVSDPLLFPKSGALWVLGCESITPGDLNSIKIRTEGRVLWIYEDIQANAGRIFVSPVVYLFRLHDATHGQSLCAIVQFKTHQMGGTTFERDNLILGSVRYIFHNPTLPESIRLVTIICSDAIVFAPTELPHPNPYLVIHIQLNSDPYHIAVRNFRTNFFQSGRWQNIEIISLNWAQGFQFLGHSRSVDYGGSAYFMHPPKSDKEPSQEDAIINANHKKGIYLRFSKNTRHSAYLFSPKELAYEFRTTKVSQCLADAVNQCRSGITAVSTYSWDGELETWIGVDEIDDGVKETFESNGGVANLSPTVREKFLTLCIGGVSSELVKWNLPPEVDEEVKKLIRILYWHKVRNMGSYCLDGCELPIGTSAKLIRSQETEIEECISKFTTLVTCVHNRHVMPDVLYDLVNGVPLIELIPDEVSSKKIRHNVRLEAGGGLATVVYLGSALPQTAKRKFADIKNTLSPQRLVVWFTHNGQTEFITDELREIMDTEESLEDITRVGI